MVLTKLDSIEVELSVSKDYELLSKMAQYVRDKYHLPNHEIIHEQFEAEFQCVIIPSRRGMQYSLESQKVIISPLNLTKALFKIGLKI